MLKERERFGSRAELGRYEPPFTPVDREAEMTAAQAEFARRGELRLGASTSGYADPVTGDL